MCGGDAFNDTKNTFQIIQSLGEMNNSAMKTINCIDNDVYLSTYKRIDFGIYWTQENVYSKHIIFPAYDEIAIYLPTYMCAQVDTNIFSIRLLNIFA